ncbi:MAG: Ig-like domain-containing protein, partial [Patescibacteria group bacterium]
MIHPFTFIRGHKTVLLIVCAAFFAVAAFLVVRPVGRRAAPRVWQQMTPLVADAVSKNAAIAVHLPKALRITPETAHAAIVFAPEIEGVWRASADPSTLLFQPSSPLDVGKYYTATIETPEVRLSKDFRADEDPEVVAIFPASDTETPETSEITIVFNRPMVPLTTLDALGAPPIDIVPMTEGRWKWSTTRNLQFIPAGRLVRSARYTVTVRPGMVSMDGLPVAGFTHTFTTRPLRYEQTSSGRHLYRAPIRVAFNQPVDLERTRREISVRRADGVPHSVVVLYGTRRVYDKKNKKTKEFLDKSVLEIYSAADRFGREGLWDFETSYTYTVRAAYPAEGDIAVGQPRSGGIQVLPIITSVSAKSPRSELVEPDLFDPQGTLVVAFAEDIVKDDTVISAKNLRDIRYDEKCREPEVGETVRYGADCEKVPNRRRLILSFDPDGLGRGEDIPVTFRKIVNTEGLVLNANPVVKTIRTYPALTIFRTDPASGATGADLTQFVACTSNPLVPATEENFHERLSSNFTVGLWNWLRPYRVRPRSPSPCVVGQFHNTIRYGLVPEYDYRLTLAAVDDFGQTAEAVSAFRSGKIDQYSRQFFHMQKGYNVTAPDKTRLTYAVENLEYVNMHICRIIDQAMLRYLKDRPKASASPDAFACAASVTRRLELPKQYWTRNYFQVNLRDYVDDPLGHYVISFGHPDYRRIEYDWDEKLNKTVGTPAERIWERTMLTVTELAVQEKKIQWRVADDIADDATVSSARMRRARGGRDPSPQLVRAALEKDGRNVYWVTRFGSIAPVPNARIALYNNGLARISGFTTDARGLAEVPASPNLFGAVVTAGNDSAIVAETADRIQYGETTRSAERTYMYTDRPIYRPGQKVFIKGIYRIGYDAAYEIPVGRSRTVEIYNSRGEKMQSGTAELNDYGTFSAEVLLPGDAPLGTYRISGFGGTAYFDVEEYVPSAFAAEVRPDKEEYIAGETMRLKVDADYFFGVPVEEGSEVTYSIASQDYYFDRYADGDFSFGRGWYYSYGGREYGDRFILRGKAELDVNGAAEIAQHLDFDKFFKGDSRERSKIFVLDVTVKNQNGQAVSAERSVIVHRGAFYLGLDTKPRFVGRGTPVAIALKSVDTQGKPIAVSGIVVDLNKISWEHFKRREVDGGYYDKSEKKVESVRQLNARTDKKGNWSAEIVLDQEGQFEIVARAADGKNNAVIARHDLYVYGPGQVSIRPTNNETLDLATPKAELDVGDQGEMIIQSPYARAKALVSFERGRIYRYEVVDVDRNFFSYVFPVTEDYIPNIYASVLLLGPDPEIKYGQINYRINTRRRGLAIDVRPSKRSYLPGEEVALDVTARNWKGDPVEAEISLAVADLSVLALKGNPRKNPVSFFYGGLPLTVTTASNIKNILEETEIPAGTKGGGGMAEARDLAQREQRRVEMTLG